LPISLLLRSRPPAKDSTILRNGPFCRQALAIVLGIDLLTGAASPYRLGMQEKAWGILRAHFLDRTVAMAPHEWEKLLLSFRDVTPWEYLAVLIGEVQDDRGGRARPVWAMWLHCASVEQLHDLRREGAIDDEFLDKCLKAKAGILPASTTKLGEDDGGGPVH